MGDDCYANEGLHFWTPPPPLVIYPTSPNQQFTHLYGFPPHLPGLNQACQNTQMGDDCYANEGLHFWTPPPPLVIYPTSPNQQFTHLYGFPPHLPGLNQACQNTQAFEGVSTTVYNTNNPYDVNYNKIDGGSYEAYGPSPFKSFRCSSGSKLHESLDQCYVQLKELKSEREKTEADLARYYPGKKMSSTNSIPVPCLPVSPNRVDRLIVDQLGEHARILTLIRNMKALRGGRSLSSSIHDSIGAWLESIELVKKSQMDETLNNAQAESRLTKAIKALVVATRRARTHMYCALTITLHE